MRRYMLGLVVAALAATAGTSSAQDFRRTVVNNSGNGVDNTIAVGNRGFRVGFPGPGGFPGAGSPVGTPFGYPGFPGGPGGYQKTIVRDSGNGIGNVIQACNGGGRGGININVITNSGNGAGNVIQTGNRR